VRSFLRVLLMARRHAAWAAVTAVAMVMVASSTVFAYNLIRPVYDQLLRPAALATPSPPRGGMVGQLDRAAERLQGWIAGVAGERVGTVLVLILLAVVAKNLFTFLARYSMARLGLATIRDLRDALFDALLKQSPGFFHSSPSGVLIARVTSDVQLVNEALSERFGDLFEDLLTVVVLAAYVFSLNFRLATAVFLLAPALLAPVLHFSRRLRREARRSQERMGEMTTIVDETVKGIRIVQAFTMEAFEAARFRRATQRHFRANLRARAIQAANAPVMEVVGAVGAVALIGYAALQIRTGAMTLGDLSAFLLGVYGAYNPVKRLNKLNLALQQAEVGAQRVFEVVDAPVAIADRPGAAPLGRVGDGVRLEQVWFAYEGERWVLEGLDLVIPSGRTVALVGPSGAGKSTVAQLVPRFWDVQQGAVRVGGVDVREVTLSSLRAAVGLVTQETVLFNDTVAANIAFGQREAARQRVEAAARAAFAHDFVTALPDGYDTVIGEAGMKLSGGQRQRLAIARALFKDPPILILDEATSALDPEAERLVQRALDNLMRGRTTLVIAHRLSTVRRADTIVVLDRGAVVEQGRHDELMARRGAYRRLVEMNELEEDA